MRLSLASILLTAAAGAFASPAKRQGIPPVTLLSPGSIVTPTDGTIIGAGDSFAFSVAVPEWNHCHPGYTPVDVYVLAAQPTTSSLNSTFQFSDYLYYYGKYIVNNFPGELPNTGTPPPSSLTMPNLGDPAETTVYLATIEIIGGCPPDGFTEYAIDSKSITYSG